MSAVVVCVCVFPFFFFFLCVQDDVKFKAPAKEEEKEGVGRSFIEQTSAEVVRPLLIFFFCECHFQGRRRKC